MLKKIESKDPETANPANRDKTTDYDTEAEIANRSEHTKDKSKSDGKDLDENKPDQSTGTSSKSPG